MKSGIRILALDDASFKPKDKRVLVIGAVGKLGMVEGAISFNIQHDGNDATKRLISRLSSSRFSKQIKLITTQSMMLGGLNYIDLFEVKKALGIECIAVTRKKPDVQELLRAIDAAKPKGAEEKKEAIMHIYTKAKKFSDSGFYFLSTGPTKEEVHGLASYITSLLRLVHIFASAIGNGESTTRL